ncbi:unnamed protein product [Rotaria sordida]|uniref:MULE transposase domain-containing protein n=1 Tax=Rotaria sordida TaxID=392033 RepID=A0A815WWY1_9BILA|nr:unnamed protein product [Rotaria sordida]CAF1549983.1 unnamed protein product [Rotaria sordida]
MVAETRSAKRAAAAASTSTTSSSPNSHITCLSSFSSSISTSVTTSGNTRGRKINRENVRSSSPSIPRSSLSKSERSVTVQLSPKFKNSSSIMSSCSSSSSSSISSRSSSTSSTSSNDSISSLNLSSLSLTSTTDCPKSSPPVQSTAVDNPIPWYKSQRGITICLDGYTYQIHGPLKTGIKWKCYLYRDPNKRCPRFIITSANTGTPDAPVYTYIKATAEHNHSPDPIVQKKNIFISKLKDLSSDPSAPPSVGQYNKLIAQMTFTHEEMKHLPTFKSLRTTLWRAHHKNMPTLPKDVLFSISEQFKVTNDEQEFIVIDHIYGKEQKRIILFSGPEQFKLLCISTQLFADGTFVVTPCPFKQTYVVQALHESGIVIPVAWILLNNKKTLTYQLLFKLLQSAAQERKLKFSPKRLMTDFETAVKSTFTILFPKTIHDGCFFHYLKSIIKRLKKYGLWKNYLIDDHVYLLVKKLMSLPMLKPDLMVVGYNLIEKELGENKNLKQCKVQLNRLFVYYYNQWLKPGHIQMVNVYGKEYRTNNFSENHSIKSPAYEKMTQQ